ncbi:MAG: glycosyl hydrolase [Rickettsiales bacterium]|nr:glycosyl hydrolase [Rickettsiales bacterium]
MKRPPTLRSTPGALAALTLLSGILLTLSACDERDAPRLYQTAAHAPSLDESSIAALNHLGPILSDDGVNFSVYSANADRLDLLLFDDPEAEQPTQQFEMSRIGEVFSLYVEGIGLGQHYGFVAWGPNWPEHEDWFPGSIHGFMADVDTQGNRFNPNKLLMDPYARAFHRDHDWSRGSIASGPARTQSTWGAAAKSVVVDSDYTWSEAETDWVNARQSSALSDESWRDLIVYEVHPKGFTADPSSGVDHPGSFRGVGEKAAYLADLGITAVELLPIHEKPLDGGYWGYNNLSFFAPELSYASDPDPRRVIDEFKEMVDQLHQHGIEVWVDVVYNHTGEGGLWRERIYQDDTSLDPGTDSNWYNFDPHEVAGIYSYRGLDNASWDALDNDGLTYWNNTGVGNQTRPNHTPTRRMIMDSMHFLVEELHVDGFRFDLAPILGEVDLDYNNWADPATTVLQDIIDDPILQAYGTRIVAEPWSAGGFYNPILGQFPEASDAPGVAWAEWNARFRDWWRAFINDDSWLLSSYEAEINGGSALTGSSPLYQEGDRRPYHSVNFVTVHDGFTMFDLLSYEEKQNGCGPLNPVCCNDPASSWCDQESGEDHNRSRNWGSDPSGEALKRQMMRNFFTVMMVSHGTPMLLGGDEWMRTQHGNNNAYSTGSDNPFNWFQWGTWQQNNERRRMHDFVRQVIRMRKANKHAFSPTAYGANAPFAWKSAANTEPPNWDSKHLMIHYYDAEAGPELAILINMERGPVEFSLPEGRTWRRLLDTQRWFDVDSSDSAEDFFDTSSADPTLSHNISLDSPEQVGASYSVQDSSIVVLEAAP